MNEDGGLPDGMFVLMTQNEMPKSVDGLALCSVKKSALALRISAWPRTITSRVAQDSLIRRIVRRRDVAIRPTFAESANAAETWK